MKTLMFNPEIPAFSAKLDKVTMSQLPSLTFSGTISF